MAHPLLNRRTPSQTGPERSPPMPPRPSRSIPLLLIALALLPLAGAREAAGQPPRRGPYPDRSRSGSGDESRFALSLHTGFRAVAIQSGLFADNKQDFGIRERDFLAARYGLEFDFTGLPLVDIVIGVETGGTGDLLLLSRLHLRRRLGNRARDPSRPHRGDAGRADSIDARIGALPAVSARRVFRNLLPVFGSRRFRGLPDRPRSSMTNSSRIRSSPGFSPARAPMWPSCSVPTDAASRSSANSATPAPRGHTRTPSTGSET